MLYNTSCSLFIVYIIVCTSFFNKFILFYLFLAALGLRCCSRVFSSCGQRGYSLLLCAGFSLRWLLLLQSMGSRHAGFSSCGTQAQLPHGMWDLLRPGLEPVSPALAGRFLTTAPPGKPRSLYLLICYSYLAPPPFLSPLVITSLFSISVSCAFS